MGDDVLDFDFGYAQRLLLFSAAIAGTTMLVNELLLQSRIKQSLPYRDTAMVKFIICVLETAIGVLVARTLVMKA